MTTRLTDPVAVRLPEDVLAGLDEIAAALDRKRSWIMVRALRLYLAGEGRQVLELAAGRREAREGHLVDAATVLEDLADDLPVLGVARR